ncbi:MAG TPA: hypothetical protein VE971_03790 [Candidatus Eisenbacteria bacterium]|nr:hypothetical protein [Candidatus Eisenbacteria bacterium]
MAEVKFDEKTLRRVGDKSGVYSSLRKISETTKDTKFIMELRAQLLKTIEFAFREHARLDYKGCTQKIEDKAWAKFERRLKKYL